MDTLWIWAGKIGLFASATLGVLKIFEWIMERRSALHCDYRRFDFPLPPGIHEHLRSVEPDASNPGIDFIREAWRDRFEVISGKVENTGKQTLEDVEIRIEGARLWQLSDRGEGPTVSSTRERFGLGKLKARERVTFTVWCSEIPSYRGDDRVVVSHAKGIARIRSYKFAGPVGVYFEQHYPILIFMLLVSALVFGVAVMTIKKRAQEDAKQVQPVVQVPAAAPQPANP